MSAFNPQSKAEWSKSVPATDFWPELSVQDFAELHRLTDTVEEARALQELKMAAIKVQSDALMWQLACAAAEPAVTQLTDHPQAEQKTLLYQTAVFEYAAAQLIDKLRDWDNTDSGHNRAEGAETRIDTGLQASREALRLLINQSRSTIELI